MVLSDEQLLLDGWHFFHELQTQRCPQSCCHCTEIMLGKLMAYLISLSAPLLELHDVAIFVAGFLAPQPWSPWYLTVTAASLQEGGLVETFCPNHYLSPTFFYQFLLRSPNTVGLYQQLLILFFSSFNSCWLLLFTRASFHILVVTCTFFFQFRIADFSFFLDRWLKLLQLLSVEHFLSYFYAASNIPKKNLTGSIYYRTAKLTW